MLGTQVLQRTPTTVVASDDPLRALEAVEVEAIMTSQLTFLVAVSNTRPGKIQISKPRVLQCLFGLLLQGSPRLQRVVLRLLRRVCGVKQWRPTSRRC